MMKKRVSRPRPKTAPKAKGPGRPRTEGKSDSRPAAGPRTKGPGRPRPEGKSGSRPATGPRTKGPGHPRPEGKSGSRPRVAPADKGAKRPARPVEKRPRPPVGPMPKGPLRQPEPGEPIEKVIWKPGTMLFPVPAVMVTSVAPGSRPNIITVAWAGTICSDPPMLSISVREATHSYGLLKTSREFVVNVPTAELVPTLDYCGVASGRDVDKFAQTRLTALPASTVGAPLIAECPVNIECKVFKTLELGTHTMFLARITAVQVSKDALTPTGRLAVEIAGLAAYAHGDYYALGRKLGHFGFSVRKRKKKRK